MTIVKAAPLPQPQTAHGVHRLSTTPRGWFLPFLASLATLASGSLALTPYAFRLLPGLRGWVPHPVFMDADIGVTLLGVAATMLLWGLVVLFHLRPASHLRIDLDANTLQLVFFGKISEEARLTEATRVHVEHQVRQDRSNNSQSPTRGAAVIHRTSTFHEYRVWVTGLRRQVFWTTNEYKAHHRAWLIRRLCRVPEGT